MKTKRQEPMSCVQAKGAYGSPVLVLRLQHGLPVCFRQGKFLFYSSGLLYDKVGAT